MNPITYCGGGGVVTVMSDSCNRMDRTQPGSSVHEIFQARILEWVAISFSRGSSRNQTRVSCITGRYLLYHTSNMSQETKLCKYKALCKTCFKKGGILPHLWGKQVLVSWWWHFRHHFTLNTLCIAWLKIDAQQQHWIISGLSFIAAIIQV